MCGDVLGKRIIFIWNDDFLSWSEDAYNALMNSLNALFMDLQIVQVCQDCIWISTYLLMLRLLQRKSKALS